MVSTIPSVYNVSDFTAVPQDEFNITTVNSTLHVGEDESFTEIWFTHVALPLCIIFIIFVFAGLIMLLIKKRRIDKLRHHLMPLYSFDPAEEGEDWEAELLEEGTDHQPIRKGSRPSEQPQLSFRNNL